MKYAWLLSNDSCKIRKLPNEKFRIYIIFNKTLIYVNIAYSYGKEVDVWSLGVIFYICLCGYAPFQGYFCILKIYIFFHQLNFLNFFNDSSSNDDETFHAIKNEELAFLPQYWDHISAEAKQLIAKMLDRNPETRIKTEAILEDKWFEVKKKEKKASAESSKKSSNKTPRSVRSKENTKISLEHSPMMSTNMFDNENIGNTTTSSTKINDGNKVKKSYKASNVL